MNTKAISSPSRVYDTVALLEQDDQWRAQNRAKINLLANGDPPFTQAEAEEAQIYTNVNFNETARELRNARSQLARAFLEQPTLVKITPDDGDTNQRMLWGQVMTEEYNRMLKRCPQYTETQESKFAGLVLHGLGPVNWDSANSWCPRPIGVEDFLTPSGTYCDLSNLTYYCVRRVYTTAELYDLITKDKAAEAGWNVALAKAMIAKKTDQPLADTGTPDYYGTYNFPEKTAEDLKQNSFWYAQARAQQIKAYDFYLRTEEGWVRRVIASSDDLPNTNDAWKTFLFTSGDRVVAESIRESIHVQIADGANVPPFRLHSVRSLGYFMYAIGHLSNRFRCREFDTAFREMMQLFRVLGTGSDTGERKALIDMIDLGVVPDGLNFVTAAERYQINYQMVGQTRESIRQLISENATAFTQDIGQRGGTTPMTATEALARSNVSSTLMAAMLTKAYQREEVLDREILCRATKKGDKASKRFVERCIARGVPAALLTADAVEDCEVVRPRALGAGNMTVEMLKAQALMGIIDRLNPHAQEIVKRIYVSAFSDDPTLAVELVPMEDPPVSESQEKASLAFTMLMARKPPVIREPIVLGEYIPALIGLLAIETMQLKEAQVLPPLIHMEGVAMLIQYIAENMAVWESQSPNGSDEVRQYAGMLKESSALVGQFVEAIMAQDGAQNPQAQDPETAAKIQQMLILAQAKANTIQSTAQLKAQQKEISFQADQRRKDAKLRSDIAAKDATTQAEIIRANTKQALEPKPEPAKK